MNISIPFNYAPRHYQLPVWQFFEGGGKRAVCVWHRRAGKDLFAINLVCSRMVERRGLYWHVFPTYNQGRKIVWDGFTKDGRSFLDYFPSPLVSSKNNTDMRVELKTGSIYQVVGSDNVDRLVGANPVGCVFSEYSLQDPRAWNLVRPILSENGGWALFIYTPRGKNHGHSLYKMAEKAGWFAQTLSVEDTGAIPLSIIEEDRISGMPEELIQQEYFCSFESSNVGAYYSNQMAWLDKEKRITKVPWEPRIPVNTAWDLGMDDSTVIWFYQEYYNELRIIDVLEASGEGLSYYAKELNKKPYAYGKHWAPHDVSVRELGSGKSRLETARSLGIKFNVVQKHDVEDGIEAVRNVLPRCWIDADKCSKGIEALKQYRKEWDEKNLTFRSQAVHDWTSHYADAFRGLAWAVKDPGKSRREKVPQKAISDYDPFNY